MNNKRLLLASVVVAGMLSGCANNSGIYAPMGGGDRSSGSPSASSPSASREPAQPRSSSASGSVSETQDSASTATPSQPRSQSPQSSQSYQQSGEAPSGAAVALMDEAQRLMLDGDVSSAIAKLGRAQRISPRSAEVYYHLSQAYAQRSELAKAEQFALRGLSYAGNNVRLQKAGWILLSNVRREAGNYAGAEQAELKAARL